MDITPTSSAYEPAFDSFKKKSLAGIAVTFLVVFGYFFFSSDNHNFTIGKNNFASSGSATLNTVTSIGPGGGNVALCTDRRATNYNGSLPCIFPLRVFLMGGGGNGLGSNDVWVSSGMLSAWNLISPDTGWTSKWPPSNNFCSVYFSNKIFVITPGNQVWSSPNGTNWSQISVNLPFSNRTSYSCSVFNNEIWLTGGQLLSGTLTNEVWHSSNGVTWTQAVPSIRTWPARYGHTSLVYQNKLWILGGAQLVSPYALNDIWSSPDGTNWTRIATAPWQPRNNHTSAVFNNQMWVLGGYNPINHNLNDVWSSSDGINWAHIDTNSALAGIQDAPWTPRAYHQTVVFDNKIWVFGGAAGSPAGSNEIWSSLNGISWTQTIPSVSWAGRLGHQAIVAPL